MVETGEGRGGLRVRRTVGFILAVALVAFMLAACTGPATQDGSLTGGGEGAGAGGAGDGPAVSEGPVVSVGDVVETWPVVGEGNLANRYPNLDGLGLDFHGTPFLPAKPAPDFELVDQRGNPFRLSDQQGHAVVLFFGYTTCPDVCPTTLLQYRQVKQKLGPDADGVRFVFVTVDPERDTPERLAGYVDRYDPSFYGLTGARDVLEELWDAYDIYIDITEVPDSPVGYWVDHTAHSFVIDPEGQLIGLYPFGIPYEYVVRDLQRLVDEAKQVATGG